MDGLGGLTRCDFIVWICILRQEPCALSRQPWSRLGPLPSLTTPCPTQSMCEEMTCSLGAGDRDKGSSTLINVPDFSIEAYTAPESFAVCLIQSAGAFQAVVRHAHSSSMPYAIGRFQQQREEHRREALHAGEAVGGLEESRRFAHVEHIVVCWNKLAKNSFTMPTSKTSPAPSRKD